MPVSQAFTRGCLPRRLVSRALTAKTLPDVSAAGAGKPAVLVDDEETGTSVRAVSDHRADCPGADSNGGSRGVMRSTVVRSRTYDTKAGGLVGVGLLTPGVGEPGA